MKKIIIIFLALISIAYAQDSTRANFPTDRGGLGFKINATELNGRPIDSTRFYKMGSDTVKRVTVNWPATYGGVYGNGSDMTSKINLLDKRPYVPEILFVYDTITTITISGALSITKAVRISKGTSFTGSGSINFNYNIIDADPDQALFATTLTITNPRSKLGYIPAKWFTVVADGATNDYTAMTKVMAATPRWVPIGLPEGKTMIGSTLSITKSIIGLGNNKSSSLIYNTGASGTDLKLAIIGADSVKLYNITFDGSNKCATLVDFGNGYKGTEISYNTFYRVEQQSSETTNTSAIHLRNNNDGTWIHHNYITQINAKNNGVSRGIWGSTSNGTPQATSPKRCIIEYNTIDGVSNTGSGSLDSDQICWQDYTDSAGLVIRFNDHYNVYKRGVKCSSPGVLVTGDRIWSSAYLIPQVTNSGISLYANQCAAVDNYIFDGRFEAGAIEVGVGDTSSISDIRVIGNYAKINSAAGGQTNRVGVKVYGTKNKLISIVGNRIYGGQIGIYLADGGRGYSVIGNEVYNTSDNAYLIASINSYPNNWHYDVQITNNKAFKCAQAVFSIGRINGGTFIGNTIDSCADDFILNYSPYIDSLIGVSAIGNTISPTGYGSGKLVNSGTYARRLPLSNPASLPGLQYYAIDSAATYIYQGGSYVKIGAAAVGGGITALTGDVTASGSGSVAATIANSAVTNAKVATGIDAAKLADGSISNTELQYINSLTSNAQTQLSGKVGTGRSLTINGTTYDLSADRTWTIDAVPTTRTITINGTTYDLSANRTWTISTMTNPMTTAGDMIIGGSSGTPTRLAKGSDGQFLKLVSGSEAWASLSKSDVGLGNVDNTSDATKNSATVTLTNKTISGSNNTFSNIPISAVTDLTAGTFSPTLSSAGNITSDTVNDAIYQRIGNVVDVTGSVNLTATSNGITTFKITLPGSPDFTSVDQIRCVVSSQGGSINLRPIVASDATNDVAYFLFTAVAGESYLLSYEMKYLIIQP